MEKYNIWKMYVLNKTIRYLLFLYVLLHYFAVVTGLRQLGFYAAIWLAEKQQMSPFVTPLTIKV